MKVYEALPLRYRDCILLFHTDGGVYALTPPYHDGINRIEGEDWEDLRNRIDQELDQ